MKTIARILVGLLIVTSAQAQALSNQQFLSQFALQFNACSPTAFPLRNGTCVPVASKADTASPAFTGTPTVNGIAIPTYPRTAAEISASVTPTDYTLAAGNVLRYGADPTGAASSTAAFQAAFSVINKGEVRVPAGTYKVSSGLITIANPVRVRGDGPFSTTINETSATGDTITVSGNSVIIEGVGFTSAVTRTAGSFVNFTSASAQITLRDFYMTGHYIGVHLTCGAYCRVQFGFLSGGATTAGSTGILVDGGNDQYLDQITMDAPAGSQPASGIQITNTGALNITDCDIIHHSSDLLINPQSGVVASVWALNSYFDTAVRGIAINPGGTGSVVRTRFTSTWGSSHTQQGIFLQADGTSTIDGVEFIGHHGLSNGGAGALLQPSSGTLKNVRILGGDFAGNTTQGIAVGAAVSDFSIIGARIGNSFGMGNNGQQGILVSAGASNNYVISNNDVRGNTVSGINDGGTGTVKIVQGNLGYNPIASTAITVTASPFTFQNNTGNTANVFVTGGTVSSVTVGGNAVAAATNTMQPVPQGASIVVTYTVAPTMTYLGT